MPSPSAIDYCLQRPRFLDEEVGDVVDDAVDQLAGVTHEAVAALGVALGHLALALRAADDLEQIGVNRHAPVLPCAPHCRRDERTLPKPDRVRRRRGVSGRVRDDDNFAVGLTTGVRENA